MKRLNILLLIIIMALTLASCYKDPIIITPMNVKDIEPIESFGNQLNQQHLNGDRTFQLIIIAK